MGSATETKNQENSLALLKQNVVDVVANKVEGFIRTGEIHLPSGYSPQNALKSAWLILQNTTTGKQDGNRPVLQTCSQNSIANALLDMIVQGLNPAKKQCYFIAYGNQLTCQRSYFGTMALAKQVDPEIDEIVAEVIYDGDVFAYSIVRGKKTVTTHEQSLDNVDGKRIKGAYCIIYYKDGRTATTIMTLEEIHQAWKQSRQNPFDDKGDVKSTSVHGKFGASMARKTVINNGCKSVINASNDSSLFLAAVNRADEIATDVEIAEEIEAHANQTMIDVEATEILLDAPAESLEPPAKPAIVQGDLIDEAGF